MATNRNKRRYLRTRASNLVAHLRVGDRLIQAPIEDISLGGMLARTSESLPIGTALMFDLARPGLKRPLRLLGVVVDTRVGRGLGIRFDGIDKDAAIRLGELIQDLGGFTHSLLADKPDEPPPRVDAPVSVARPPTMPPPPQVGQGPFATPANTGAFRVPGQQPQPPQQHQAPDVERLQAQLRTMVMELGRAQEQIAQKERELQDARAEIDKLKAELRAGNATTGLMGRLEIEKTQLQAQLAEQRARVGELEREAEIAGAALGRMIDTMRRLR
ncbi:MAG: PilZ domain-containing protein [Deltaproteobacteria bacterium]|nr:PilZ domain-containing protein [Deltaproteobacteria bacterium]